MSSSGKRKSAESLIPFRRKLNRRRGQIEAVAIDMSAAYMSAAYISAVQEYLPQAEMVFDRFHVVKLMKQKATDRRRQLFTAATEDEKSVLKGSRWLLLKNPENLTEERDEQARLDEALALNEPLAIAYYLKEELRQFWNKEFRFACQALPLILVRAGDEHGVEAIGEHRQNVTAGPGRLAELLQSPHHVGPVEGTNNKVKTVQRQSYGFREHEYFKLVLYSLHQTKYALVG